MSQKPPANKPTKATDLPPKPKKYEPPPAPGSGRVAPRRNLTPAARLGSQLIFIVAVVGIIGLVTYPVWRSIVFPDPVTTRFSQLPPEQQKAIESLPAEQRSMLLKLAEQNPQQAADTAVALLQPPLTMSEEIRFLIPTGQEVKLFAEGTFAQQSALYGASGKAQVYKSGLKFFLKLTDFSVIQGPELHIALAKEAAPSFATLNTWYGVGPLKGQLGSIIYPLGDNFDIAAYQSVVIYDVKYSTINSVAVLEQ
jgi:hypothetical protein